jgi:cyclopropane fatty-acyl-phospholipid synthase-like methyltransferase
MANSDIFTRKDIEKSNIEFYSDVELSGADGWQTEPAQQSNYNILLDIAGKLEQRQRILDVGCGTGHLYRSLDARTGIDYVGIDIRSDVIQSLKTEFKDQENRFLDHTLDSYIEKEKPPIFDYVFASGTYNVKVDDSDMQEYLEDQIDKLWGLAKVGVAFNCTSIYAYNQDDVLQYYHPVSVFSHCMTKCDRVALLHDYDISEFTIYMYR